MIRMNGIKDSDSHRLIFIEKNGQASTRKGVYYHTGLYGKFKEAIGSSVKVFDLHKNVIYLSRSSLTRYIHKIDDQQQKISKHSTNSIE